jgi:putative inorganic carbon (hco3(-)) transporter
MKRAPVIPIEDMYALKPRAFWEQFKQEHFSFWMICAYLFVEYVRPQSIFSSLDILPWAKVCLILTLVGRLADRKAKWVSDSANLWMVLFLITIVASCFMATWPQYSWAHLMDFGGWFLIYFLIINTVTTERRLLIFLAVFLLASYKLSFFGAKVWTLRGFAFTKWGIQGPPGFFQNSGEYAIQMLMFSPVAAELALFLKPFLSKLKFWFLLTFPITGAMSIMGASSRGAQIALVYQLYGTILKGRLSFKTIMIAAIVVWAGFSLLPEEQKARFSSAGGDNTSQQRLLYWKRGIEMIEDHPALGVGFFNFPLYMAAKYPQDVGQLNYDANGVASSELPHNIFIQVGTDTGFIGLGIFLALILRTAKACREIRLLVKQHPDDRKPFAPLAKGFLVAMWGFVIAGMFVTVTYYPFFWINLAFVVSLRNITRSHYQGVASVARHKNELVHTPARA